MKVYRAPSCTQKSVADVVALLRRTASNRDGSPLPHNGRTTEIPILLVEGYEGSPLIGATLRNVALPLSEDSGGIGINLVEVHSFSVSETVLVVDLRQQAPGERALEVNLAAPNADGAAIVILIKSFQDFHAWGPIRATHCWQLAGPIESGNLIRALLSILAVSRGRDLPHWDEEFQPDQKRRDPQDG